MNLKNKYEKNTLANKAPVIACLSIVLGLLGCQQEGTAEKAGQKIDRAAENAQQKIEQTTEKAAQKIAERLLNIARAAAIKIDDQLVSNVTISIGIAQFKIGKESWEELLGRADKALYLSKNNGRDRWTTSGSK